jgi:hypothetical protein
MGLNLSLTNLFTDNEERIIKKSEKDSQISKKTGFGNRSYTKAFNLLTILTITEEIRFQLQYRAVYVSSPHLQDLRSNQI